jgi:hypothetical protein
MMRPAYLHGTRINYIYQSKSKIILLRTLFYLLDACFDEESGSDASTDDNQYLDENEIDDDDDDDESSCWSEIEDEVEEEVEDDEKEEVEEEHRSSFSSDLLSEESVQQHLKCSEDDVIVRRKHTETVNATKDSSNVKLILQGSRREKISAFAALNEQNIFDAIDYISEESIARAILAPCCRDECLRKKLNPISLLNFEGAYSKVLEARRQLVGNEWKDKMLILKAILQGIYTSAFLLSLR